MKIADLLPRNFSDLGIIDQIDWMIDAYGMAGKLSGDSNKFIEDIEMLEIIKKEVNRRNVSFNIFDITGDSMTKDKFVELKTNSCF
jgi:uncharacterized protein (DUF2252 family)